MMQCSGLIIPDTLIKDYTNQILKESLWDRNDHINNIVKNSK
jgi:hypothetical protein